MNFVKKTIKSFLFKNIYLHWNIAIAEIGSDFTPINIIWLKHNYTDRWFADPFIVGENDNSYVVLVEEYMGNTSKGRIARLTVCKETGKIIQNTTIIDIKTHLSFPNILQIDNEMILYPENACSGVLSYYKYTHAKTEKLGILCDEPLVDTVIFQHEKTWYLFATIGNTCNKNVLHVFKSDSPLKNYQHDQEIVFEENIARRAGNVFVWKGKIYSPAQVCNHDYGEALSMQELTFEGNKISLNEIKRFFPLSRKYKHGFHTYNVFNNTSVAIDGYYYPHPKLSNLYKIIRGNNI